MAELRCLNCNEPFDREQGHRCLNSPWSLEIANANKILQDIEDELYPDENEFITSGSDPLSELSKFCIEIFNRISDPCTDSSLPKEVTFETDQHNHSSAISILENSETYDKQSISNVHAVPGPSRLPLSENKGSGCKVEFQTKRYKAGPTNVNPLTFQVCQKVFKEKCILKRHMQIHGGEKKHRCDFCGKSFHVKTNLKAHVRTHTGEKPFSCVDCGMRFRKNYHLKRHLISHGGRKPYKCDICGKSYAEKYNLKMHVMSHTGEKRFTCKVCGKGYILKSHLKQHMNNHK
ncbi:Zinc finger protein 473 like protein [Argiope bruennichi]|uniref:Zinc finger protein 473 like protein n=1 Tax=Argiope bruennichi TaxID=94029 RepID=A0A8T0FCP2_ARGBR|nr:Zinc finger protein 473 like protein [Argiope bruennichi]